MASDEPTAMAAPTSSKIKVVSSRTDFANISNKAPGRGQVSAAVTSATGKFMPIVRVVVVLAAYVFMWTQFIGCNWCKILEQTGSDDAVVDACKADPQAASGANFGEHWCDTFDDFLLGGICYAGVFYMFVTYLMKFLWCLGTDHVVYFHVRLADELLGLGEAEEMKARIDGKKEEEEEHDDGEETQHAVTGFELIHHFVIPCIYFFFWFIHYGCNVPSEWSWLGDDWKKNTGQPDICVSVDTLLFEALGKAGIAYLLGNALSKLMYAAYRGGKAGFFVVFFGKDGYVDQLIGINEMREADETIKEASAKDVEVSISEKVERRGSCVAKTELKTVAQRIAESDTPRIDMLRIAFVLIWPSWMWVSIILCVYSEDENVGELSAVRPRPVPEFYCEFWSDVVMEGICKCGINFVWATINGRPFWYLQFEAQHLLGYHDAHRFVQGAYASEGEDHPSVQMGYLVHTVGQLVEQNKKLSKQIEELKPLIAKA